MATMTYLEGIRTVTVDKVMTANLIVATEDDDIDYVQAAMTENRISHLPVIENNALVGLISIGDIVKYQVKEKDVEIRYLKEYIADKYPC